MVLGQFVAAKFVAPKFAAVNWSRVHLVADAIRRGFKFAAGQICRWTEFVAYLVDGVRVYIALLCLIL